MEWGWGGGVKEGGGGDTILKMEQVAAAGIPGPTDVCFLSKHQNLPPNNVKYL